MARRAVQGKRISDLVTTMVTQLNAYKGSKQTRHRYAKFRTAKRELYKLRPDIAPGIMAFVVSQTHWGTAGASGFAELQEQRQREARAKRQSESKAKRQSGKR